MGRKSKHHANSSWLPTSQAAVALGLSARRLRDLRKQGLFKPREHYRITSAPHAARLTYQWHVRHCEEALATPPERRR